jgi:hypothetical protein
MTICAVSPTLPYLVQVIVPGAALGADNPLAIEIKF